MEKRYKNLIKDLFFFGIGRFGSKLVLFFLLPIYTHCLTTEEYGTIELAETFVQFLLPFISLVIFDSVLRFSLEENINQPCVLLNALIIVFIGSSIVFIFTPFIPPSFTLAPWKEYIAFYISSYFLNVVLLTYIQGKKQITLYLYLGLSQSVIFGASAVLFLYYFNYSVEGFLLASIISTLSTSILAIFKGKLISDISKAYLDKNLLARMLCYSSPLIINNISFWLIQYSNKAIIDYFLGTTLLGLYAVSSKIPALINIFTSIFSQAWGITSVKEYNANTGKSFYSNVFSYFQGALCIVCSFMLIIIKPFMSSIVSIDFFACWQYVPILMVSAVFGGISSYLGNTYFLVFKSINATWTTLFAAIINIILNIMLIPKFGLFGSIFSTLSSYIGLSLIRLYDTRRYLYFSIPWTVWLQPILLIISATITTFYDKHLPYTIAIFTIILTLNIPMLYSTFNTLKKLIIK